MPERMLLELDLSTEQALAFREVLERMKPADLMQYAGGDWNKGMDAWESLCELHKAVSIAAGLE